MKRLHRTKIQVLAVGVTAVALGLTASPAHAADLNLGNLAQVKVLGGNGNVADVQVPGLGTGATVDTGNGVNVNANVGGGAKVGVNLGGSSGGANANVDVGGGDTTKASDPGSPSSPSSGPSTPTKPTKGKGKTTVKKVVKRLGADSNGKGTRSGSGGSTTTTYLTGAGSSAGRAASSAKGRSASTSVSAGTDRTTSAPAGVGTNSAALSSDGDRLTNGGGHSGLFWVWWLLFAALVGSGITFLATRLRRRHQESLLRKRMAALGEELAVTEDHVGEGRVTEEKELVSAVPGLAPPRRV